MISHCWLLICLWNSSGDHGAKILIGAQKLTQVCTHKNVTYKNRLKVNRKNKYFNVSPTFQATSSTFCFWSLVYLPEQMCACCCVSVRLNKASPSPKHSPGSAQLLGVFLLCFIHSWDLKSKWDRPPCLPAQNTKVVLTANISLRLF